MIVCIKPTLVRQRIAGTVMKPCGDAQCDQLSPPANASRIFCDFDFIRVSYCAAFQWKSGTRNRVTRKNGGIGSGRTPGAAVKSDTPFIGPVGPDKAVFWVVALVG